jgi:hypothetical protein
MGQESLAKSIIQQIDKWLLYIAKKKGRGNEGCSQRRYDAVGDHRCLEVVFE